MRQRILPPCQFTHLYVCPVISFLTMTQSTSHLANSPELSWPIWTVVSFPRFWHWRDRTTNYSVLNYFLLTFSFGSGLWLYLTLANPVQCARLNTTDNLRVFFAPGGLIQWDGVDTDCGVEACGAGLEMQTIIRGVLEKQHLLVLGKPRNRVTDKDSCLTWRAKHFSK